MYFEGLARIARVSEWLREGKSVARSAAICTCPRTGI